MRLKRISDFIINRLPIGVEAWAWAFVWIFGMVLAILTVITILPPLTRDTRLTLLGALILFLIATTIVFIFEARRRFLPRPTREQANRQIPAHVEQSGQNTWISIGLLVVIVIVLGLIFVARQLPATPQGYQTFFMAFAGVGAWVTGITLAVFAYQQYKLRQTEHRLLFEPQIFLSGGSPKIGLGVFNNKKYPYRIEWPVFIYNTSQMPVLIEYMQVRVKLTGEDSGREGLISPTYCHVVEPENLSGQFEVTLTKPCHITWIVEGSSAGDVFDYVSGDSGKRDFVLIFRVIAKRPQDPEEAIFLRETVSWSIHVPKDANWGPSIPYVI